MASKVLRKGEKSVIIGDTIKYNILTLDKDVRDEEEKCKRNVPKGRYDNDTCLTSQALRFDDKCKIFK